MEKSNRTYLGKGRASDEYDLINFSICLTDIPKDKIIEYKGKKYLKLTIARMKEPDKYNKTHTIYLNDFVPEKQNELPENPF